MLLEYPRNSRKDPKDQSKLSPNEPLLRIAEAFQRGQRVGTAFNRKA